MTHDIKGGKQCGHPLLMVGSVPHTRQLNDEGAEVLVPLKVVTGMRRTNKDGSSRSCHHYAAPCIHGDFKHVHRLFPEDETALKNGEYSRFFPTGTEQFTRLYGRRNATESWHAELKRIRRRPPVRGIAMQSFYLSCMTVLQNARNIERMRRAAAPPGGKAA